MTNTARNSGNVLVFILIAIFLLGALTALLLRSSGNTDETGNKERATLMASQILQFSGTVKAAVERAQVQGCSESQINFENPVTQSELTSPAVPYANTYQKSVPDECRIFQAKGQGVNFSLPPEGSQDASQLTMDNFLSRKRYAFAATNGSYSGDANGDLFLILPNVTLPVCKAINRALNIGSSTETAFDINGDLPFNGTYFMFGTIDTAAATSLKGKKAGCLKINGQSKYYFYSILLSR